MFIGHTKQWNRLEKIAKGKKFAHAYLFSGPEKLGKRTVALAWVARILEQKVTNLNQHPDFIFIEPSVLPGAKGTSRKEIRIAQVKDLIKRLSLKPNLASKKVAIINDAHLISSEAQTCLLKTLEEPRGDTLLILITDKPQKLFTTILSRLQIVKFYPVSDKLLVDYFTAKNKALEFKKIIGMAYGRPGVVFDYVLDPLKAKFYDTTVVDLKKIITADLAFRFQYVKKIAPDTEELKEILEIWISYFREKLGVALNKKESTVKLRRILEVMLQVNSLIFSTNVNTKLALECLMLEL